MSDLAQGQDHAGAPTVQRKKAIVAIHGVGDQIKYATVRAVLNQFSAFRGDLLTVPLGRFHSGIPRETNVDLSGSLRDSDVRLSGRVTRLGEEDPCIFSAL